LANIDVEESARNALPAQLMARGTALPYAIEAGRLQVAVADPSDVALIDEIRLSAGLPVDFAIAPAADIARLCSAGPRTRRPDASRLRESDAPAVRAIETMLMEAIERRASDIHLLPTPHGLDVRLRIDGIVVRHSTIPPDVAPAAMARIKVMASLDIAEHRLPQDGRFVTPGQAGGHVDVRVVVMPTISGEGAVLRLLETSRRPPLLSEIGLSNAMQMELERLTGRMGGALVLAGPTGSGKTTTLYATLADLAAADVNIITVEDPVEYWLPDVYQLQVNRSAEFTFASALRSILRADPDIVMVGEIRDPETAQIAIEAAITGHLLLTTIHAKDAPSTVVRLLDLGVRPHLLGAGLGAVVAQRLARRLCVHCREAYAPGADELAGADWEDAPPQLYRSRGCEQCDRGYSGRVGIFELMPVTGDVVAAIREEGSYEDLVRAADEAGRTSLWSDGLAKVAAGDLGLDELRRVLS
jgi:type IV pilus assembly protein PilB